MYTSRYCCYFAFVKVTLKRLLLVVCILLAISGIISGSCGKIITDSISIGVDFYIDEGQKVVMVLSRLMRLRNM